MDTSKLFPNKFAKGGVDLKHNMIITFLDGGSIRKGKDFDGNEADIFDIAIGYEDASGERQEKIFTLNGTNTRSIQELYGMDSDKWVGKAMAIVLIPDTKAKSGKRVVLTPPGANYQ